MAHYWLYYFFHFLRTSKSNQRVTAKSLVDLLVVLKIELLLEVYYRIIECFVFTEQFMTLGTALDRTPRLNEHRHLFEKFILSF